MVIAGILSGLNLQLHEILAVLATLHGESWDLFKPELKFKCRTYDFLWKQTEKTSEKIPMRWDGTSETASLIIHILFSRFHTQYKHTRRQLH